MKIETLRKLTTYSKTEHITFIITTGLLCNLSNVYRKSLDPRPS